MPDILRVTTPLVNKNLPVPPKTGVDPMNPFNIQDTSRVIQTHNQSELLKQNTGTLEGGDTPTLLMNLLKDPSVTVSYLKNIFLLEEIFKLLPANNTTVTREIEQVFDTLLMLPTDIAPEMLRQGKESTMFNGELFDFLRQISNENPDKTELQGAIANVLKSLNNFMCKNDIVDAVKNNLLFLRESLSTSRSISSKLDGLIARFETAKSDGSFPDMKNEVLALLKDVENSILFSPKLSKILSITVYNLSRYNDNTEFIGESAYRMRQFLTAPQSKKLMQLMKNFINDVATEKTQSPASPADENTSEAARTSHSPRQSREGAEQKLLGDAPPLTGKQALKKASANLPELSSIEHPDRLAEDEGKSKVMRALTQLVAKQSEESSVNTSDAAKVEKILHSLLSSPCNFTPLLHFIVPTLFQDMRAFAEIWINPKSDEKDMPQGIGSGLHFLMVVDVESVGRFEAEFFVHDKTIDFSLFCPPGYERKYEDMMRSLPHTLAGLPYKIGETRLEPLERPRSLMDVFKSLPYKRVGVDVKI